MQVTRIVLLHDKLQCGRPFLWSWPARRRGAARRALLSRRFARLREISFAAVIAQLLCGAGFFLGCHGALPRSMMNYTSGVAAFMPFAAVECEFPPCLAQRAPLSCDDRLALGLRPMRAWRAPACCFSSIARGSPAVGTSDRELSCSPAHPARPSRSFDPSFSRE